MLLLFENKDVLSCISENYANGIGFHKNSNQTCSKNFNNNSKSFFLIQYKQNLNK